MELFTPGHLIVLAIVITVLFFGWKQLPDMARSLGRSLRVFKTEIKGMSEDDKVRDTSKQGAANKDPVAIDAPKVVRIAPEPRQPATGTRPRPAPSQNQHSSAATSDRPASTS